HRHRVVSRCSSPNGRTRDRPRFLAPPREPPAWPMRIAATGLQTGSQSAPSRGRAPPPRSRLDYEKSSMDLQDTIRTYRLFSGSYDVVFGPIFHLGRKDAVRIANALPGQRILEVGVGTGLSLPFFRSDSEVTGIDISAEMLAKAHRRVERQNLKHVKELSVMDAEKMDFPDNSFDAVMGMYVASVVPNPAHFAAE